MSQQLLDPWGPLKVFGVGIALFGKVIPVVAVVLVLAWVFFWPASEPQAVDRSDYTTQWCADLRAAQDFPLPDDCS